MTTLSPTTRHLGGETSVPDRARVRAMLLLLAYVVGSAAVAALLAVGAGLAWQELFDWALPYVTPRSLPG